MYLSKGHELIRNFVSGQWTSLSRSHRCSRSPWLAQYVCLSARSLNMRPRLQPAPRPPHHACLPSRPCLTDNHLSPCPWVHNNILLNSVFIYRSLFILGLWYLIFSVEIYRFIRYTISRGKSCIRLNIVPEAAVTLWWTSEAS